MSYIPCMVYANRVLLTCMYHMNFAYGRFSPVRGCGFLVVAHVAPLRGRGWLSAGLCDYGRAYWSQICRRSRSVGAEPGRVLPVPAGGCRVGRCRVFPWTRAVCCTCGHVDAPNDMFILFFCILLCLIISIPREFTIYVCLIISLPRGFTIFVVFTTSLYILALYILALLWSYTSLGLMLFVVKTTWNKAYSILFYSILFRRPTFAPCLCLFDSVLYIHDKLILNTHFTSQVTSALAQVRNK